MQSRTKESENGKGRLFQAGVTGVGVLLWLIAAASVFTGYAWRDQMVLLALVPLIVIVSLFPISFPLPTGWSSRNENVNFTLIDAFVLIAASWYGITAAVLIAGVEGFTSSRRLVRRLSSNLFSSGMMALAAAAASYSLSLVLHYGWAGGDVARNHKFSSVAIALLIASVVQVSVNWGLLSTLLALRHSNSIVREWKENFLCSAPMFLPTGVVASLMYFALQYDALVMIAIGGPILLAIYFGHRQYRTTAEQAEQAERKRAEQAERHVEELSRYIAEQERILEQFAQVEKLSALGELASGVAHDLNNTLAGILGRAQLLLMHSGNPEVERGLQIIIKTAQDGAKTIKRIQDFARQRRDHDFAPVPVDQLLMDVGEITRPRWKDRAEAANIHINLELEIRTNALVMGDESELREVLVNMVFNAVDAMPKGGRLALSARDADGAVEISVSDSGSGMSSEVRSRIFDPFFTTKGKAGMGLGLAVSFGIIRRHEGTIEVDSEVGRGTTFRITLPVAEGAVMPESQPETVAPVKPVPQPKRTRILVVDDEDYVRELLYDILESEGYEAILAEGGREALALFDAEEFDAVFTDVGMPEMSGWELARAVRERDARIPLAVLTGWGEAVGSDEQRAAKVDWVITKPFTLDRIRELAEEVSRSKPETSGARPSLKVVAA